MSAGRARRLPPAAALACAALLALAAAGCRSEAPAPQAQRQAGAEQGPERGDTIVVGSIGDASNLLPALASDSSSFEIIGLVYGGLVRYDKDLKIEGELASSWEISPDGLRITFANGEIVHLRPSGNAPELRCYAEADNQERAAALATECLARVGALPD